MIRNTRCSRVNRAYRKIRAVDKTFDSFLTSLSYALEVVFCPVLLDDKVFHLSYMYDLAEEMATKARLSCATLDHPLQSPSTTAELCQTSLTAADPALPGEAPQNTSQPDWACLNQTSSNAPEIVLDLHELQDGASVQGNEVPKAEDSATSGNRRQRLAEGDICCLIPGASRSSSAEENGGYSSHSAVCYAEVNPPPSSSSSQTTDLLHVPRLYKLRSPSPLSLPDASTEICSDDTDGSPIDDRPASSHRLLSPPEQNMPPETSPSTGLGRARLLVPESLRRARPSLKMPKLLRQRSKHTVDANCDYVYTLVSILSFSYFLKLSTCH